MSSSPPPPPATTPATTTTTIILPPPPSQPPPPQPQPPPPRKFPAPCWTQDETLALIHCYQDKWFSLRRRNLRTADWESVADDVNRRCPNQSPPKTSAQCRHKMEKLRKRYRAEKQRISNLPLNYTHLPHHHPKFFPSSSWVFFDLMDAMEIGSSSTHPGSGSGSGSGPTSTPTPTHILPPDVNLAALKQKNTPNFQNGGNDNSLNHNGGTREDLGKYFDEILRSVGKSGIAPPPTKFKVKNSASHNHDGNYFDDDDDDGNDDDQGYDNHVFNNRKRKFGGGERIRGVPNGYPPSKRGERGGGGGGGRGGGGGDEVVGEMVASIRMLGEGLVKMEKMKMELMQDLERQRMEMEMNNTRMILESQHNIVAAFLHGFRKHHHHKNKVVKVVQME